MAMTCGRFVAGLVVAAALSACGATTVDQSVLLEDTSMDLIGKEWTLDLPMHFAKMQQTGVNLATPNIDWSTPHGVAVKAYPVGDCNVGFTQAIEGSPFGLAPSIHAKNTCPGSNGLQWPNIFSMHFQQVLLPKATVAALIARRPNARYRIEVRADLAMRPAYEQGYGTTFLRIGGIGLGKTSEYPRQKHTGWQDFHDMFAQIDGITLEQVQRVDFDILTELVVGVHLRRVRWVIYNLD